MIKTQKRFNFKSIEEYLKSRIFGQEHIINNVLDIASISFAGLNDPEKPKASFLFTGPTGVGKTEFAKELAKILKMNFLRFDMSEYSDQHSARNLTGGNAGLVGYDEGGLLTNEVLKNPNSIILLDEIEKAHKVVYNTFLQVLDYGVLTDTKGKKAKFHNCIIIMTSNLGANEQNGIGFGNTDINREKAVVTFLTPEFRNRLDKILEFEPIDENAAYRVVEKFVDDFKEDLQKKGIALEVSKDALAYLSEIGFHNKMGARSVIRAINNEFKKTISKLILSSDEKLLQIHIDFFNEEFHYECKYQEKKHVDNLLYEDAIYFPTAQEAHEYAKERVGTVITRAFDRVGFIAKP